MGRGEEGVKDQRDGQRLNIPAYRKTVFTAVLCNTPSVGANIVYHPGNTVCVVRPGD